MRFAKRIVNWAATITMVAALLALMALAVAIAMGLKPAVVKTGSMRPLLDPGELILVKPTDANRLKVGDVITFTDPDMPAKGLVTHRIVKRVVEKGRPVFTTQGDANPVPDPWRLKLRKDAGRMKFHVPTVGRLSFLVRTKKGYLTLLGIPVLLLSIMAMARIWTSGPPDREANEDQVAEESAEEPAGDADSTDARSDVMILPNLGYPTEIPAAGMVPGRGPIRVPASSPPDEAERRAAHG